LTRAPARRLEPAPAFHRLGVVDRVTALTRERRAGVPPAWLGAVAGAAALAAGTAAYATGALVGMIARIGF
jgi:hypothetical protein